jgi:hypothetical protein
MGTRDFSQGAGVDDDVANDRNNTAGQHLPSLTSFVYPPTFPQTHADANASDFTAANPSRTIQPDIIQSRSQHQVRGYQRK